jgi:hypothetical protein
LVFGWFYDISFSLLVLSVALVMRLNGQGFFFALQTNLELINLLIISTYGRSTKDRAKNQN